MAAWQYGGYRSYEATAGFPIPSYGTIHAPAMAGNPTGPGPWPPPAIPTVLPPPLPPPDAWFHGLRPEGYRRSFAHLPGLAAYAPPLPEYGPYSLQQHPIWAADSGQLQGLNGASHPFVSLTSDHQPCPPFNGVSGFSGGLFTLYRGSNGFVPRTNGFPAATAGRALEMAESDCEETGGVGGCNSEPASERTKRARTDEWNARTQPQLIPASPGVSVASAPTPSPTCQTDCPDMPGVAITQAVMGGKQFWCPENSTCNLAFSSVKKLQKHLRLKHHIDRPFQCNEDGCGAMLASRAALVTHARTHSGEKPFVCDVAGCGAAFSQNSNLKRHKATHENKKMHGCSAPGCNQVFLRKGLLQDHLREHKDFRPFACSVEGCTSRFRLRVGLTVHMRTHTGERPYPCSDSGCDKSFKTSSQLKRHELALHGSA